MNLPSSNPEGAITSYDLDQDIDSYTFQDLDEALTEDVRKEEKEGESRNAPTNVINSKVEETVESNARRRNSSSGDDRTDNSIYEDFLFQRSKAGISAGNRNVHFTNHMFQRVKETKELLSSPMWVSLTQKKYIYVP